MADAVVTEIKRLRPEPGDVFVFSVERNVTQEQAERIRASVGDKFPDCTVLLIEKPVTFEGLFGAPMGATLG